MQFTYRDYDQFIANCYAEMAARHKNTSQPILLTPSQLNSTEKLRCRLYSQARGVFNYDIYINMNFFVYWYFRLCTKIKIPRWTHKLKKKYPNPICAEEPMFFFTRPLSMNNFPYTIIEEVYNAYYR